MPPKNDETTKLTQEIEQLRRDIRSAPVHIPRTAVGDLNGPYALLFKVNMFAIPIMLTAIISYGVWINLQLRDQAVFNGETKAWQSQWNGYPKDAELLKLQVMGQVTAKTDAQYTLLLTEISKLRDQIRDLSVAKTATPITP